MPNHAKSPLSRLASSLRELHERHRERHRPTGFGFVLADKVDHLDRQSWDALAGNLFLRREVLRVIEQHGPENLLPRYAMIFRDDKPVAALAAQIVSLTGDRLRRDSRVSRENPSPNLLRRALSPTARAAGANMRERILVGGNLLSWGFHGIAFAPDEDPAGLWPGVAEALYRIRRAERLTGREALRRFSYRPLETEPNMLLSLNPAWDSYDHYLAALDAKYRRNSKDQLKKFAAAGCTVESLADLDAHAPRLHQLYLAVQGNASVRLVTLRESYLPALARALGESFRCHVIRRGGDILGFVTSLRDGKTAIAYYIGFDRVAAADGLPIYLRLLHATIGDAITWRCERLSLGRTALEPKAALGAKPEPMSIWLRHRVPALNWLLRGLLGAVPHAEAPERNPFKFVPDANATSK